VLPFPEQDPRDPRIDMRRKDRAITDEGAIEQMLADSAFGFIATAIDDQPYLIANLYWYQPRPRRLYFHTADEGRTRSNLLKNPKVCFALAEMGKLLPAKTASEFSTEYRSVTVFGRARLVEDEQEQHLALQGLLDKYFPQLRPGEHYRPIQADELAYTSVFAIEIEAWSGKRKVANR
jgi:nitroimidazol reductase NimA-like FMN-containing flavoprotein (pyridoxamine 5'-phosphate oxidase superfamily)